MKSSLPTPERLVAMACDVVMACRKGDLENALACEMVDGLCLVWCAAFEHANPADPIPMLETFAEAERAYRAAFRHLYEATMRRHGFPHYEVAKEETVGGWWPDALTARDCWPRRFLLKLATVVAEVEAKEDARLQQHLAEQGKEGHDGEGREDAPSSGHC